MISKRTAARMARLVAQWRASGDSGASFARRHHIPAWTFWYWCRKLSAEPRTGDAAGTPPPTFVPVRMAVEPDTPAIEMVLSGGERLHVRAAASAELVRAVIAALRTPC